MQVSRTPQQRLSSTDLQVTRVVAYASFCDRYCRVASATLSCRQGCMGVDETCMSIGISTSGKRLPLPPLLSCMPVASHSLGNPPPACAQQFAVAGSRPGYTAGGPGSADRGGRNSGKCEYMLGSDAAAAAAARLAFRPTAMTVTLPKKTINLPMALEDRMGWMSRWAANAFKAWPPQALPASLARPFPSGTPARTHNPLHLRHTTATAAGVHRSGGCAGAKSVQGSARL